MESYEFFIARAWHYFYQDLEALIYNGTITKEQKNRIIDIALASEDDVQDTDYRCERDPLEVESADVVTRSNIQFDMEILFENNVISRRKVNRITEILFNE